MIVKLEVDRGYYKANIEISESEVEGIQEFVLKKLNQIDLAIRSSSAIWHSKGVTRYGIEFMPNGSVHFPLNATSMIDQLLLLTAAGGSRGITFQESSYLLGIPTTTVGSRFTGKQYAGLFRKVEEGRYSLSAKGIQKIDSIVKGGTSGLPDSEVSIAAP